MTTIDDFTLELPSINGDYEVGLAVGTDKSLPAEKKLHPLGSQYRDQAKRIAYAASSATYALGNQELMTIACGAAIEMYGGVGKAEASEDNIQPDSDVIFDAAPLADIAQRANDRTFREKIKLAMLRVHEAMLLMVSTKVTYYQTNHHTGGRLACHYVKKVYDLTWGAGDNARSSDEATGDIHSVGHWISTRLVLLKIGFANVKNNGKHPAMTGIDWSITDDVKLRQSTYPAGTAKHGACKEALKRLSNSTIMTVMPGFNDIPAFANTCKTIEQGGAKYHEGAYYLTGSAQIKLDGPPSIAWQLGTFILKVHPKSKLAKASAFSEENMGMYEDVHEGWARLCAQYTTADIDAELDMSIFGVSTSSCPTMNELVASYTALGKAITPEMQDPGTLDSDESHTDGDDDDDHPGPGGHNNNNDDNDDDDDEDGNGGNGGGRGGGHGGSEGGGGGRGGDDDDYGGDEGGGGKDEGKGSDQDWGDEGWDKDGQDPSSWGGVKQWSQSISSIIDNDSIDFSPMVDTLPISESIATSTSLSWDHSALDVEVQTSDIERLFISEAIPQGLPCVRPGPAL
ncbi:hypothetical protein FOCC_FOCC009614 [Frankliniella occidentalis]|nr:hypothetical protein FOCC_FOCC009614 [Frankliniella occidentalis]